MTEQDILLQKKEGIGIVTLNRPEKYNSFNLGMYRKLLKICDEIKEDNDIRVVIVTGAGKNFSAGADLSSGSDGVSEHQNNEYVLSMSINPGVLRYWPGCLSPVPFLMLRSRMIRVARPLPKKIYDIESPSMKHSSFLGPFSRILFLKPIGKCSPVWPGE